MSKFVEVEIEVEVPKGVKAGETFTTTVQVELPSKGVGNRGQLYGIALEDMTVDQLKRERINAASVLYKAEKREAAPETIAKNRERLDAVVAMLAIKNPPKVKAAKEESVEATDEAEGTIETAADIAAEL